ncbi:hypothetical protein [Allocoleopsis sp.]|uniref:hypothetical protein n=1 Tax=Allocoleopsis sp. TaxID=3088169 RepID=UPI002FD39728
MNNSCLKKQSTRLVGAMFILLGVAAPSEATTLSGFSTYGDMMNGMRITASFLDGTSQSLIWGATGSGSGGVLGSGWSLTESGNTYPQVNDPNGSFWTLSNFAQGMTSLVIDAVPGNTLFDNYPLLEGPLNTPGSAEGWNFQPTSGQAPTSYAYSDPINISYGDLFGRLSLYWPSGFTGVMQFLADTDSGTSNDPVQIINPVTQTIPPTVSFTAPTIYEGQSAPTIPIFATDPNDGAITFFLNGQNIGTDFTRSGTRQASINPGFFADNGDYVYTAQVRNENGTYSSPVSSVLTVLNLPPTVTDLSIPTIYEGQSATAYISATDPGADAINFYLNGNYVGTDLNTSGTRAVSTNLGLFADNGYIPYTASTLDKDGAWSDSVSGGLTVLNVAPTLASFDLSQYVINEGQSVSALLTATDPGADSETFFINGNSIGTDLVTSGTRLATTSLGPFATGTYTFTGKAQDKDGADSNVITRTLQVLNVAPTITKLTQNLVAKAGEFFNFAVSAFDPGKSSNALTYEWDLNGDGLFNDFVGATGQWSFPEYRNYKVAVRVSDGNGGYAYGSLNVESVPEPGSTLGVLVFSAGGATVLWKRKHQHKKNNQA